MEQQGDVPIKDWICPRCRHNISVNQAFCDTCGLQLNWGEVNNITCIPKSINSPYSPPYGIGTIDMSQIIHYT